ncbi:type II toxin-antitoxin system RelE/ParE family toxin [bacterium]|nr:type II toxin-antitoxin system RelE/ParE family toxin [bacterium]
MSEDEPPYSIAFTDTAAKSLQRFPKNDQKRIVAKIEQLASAPLQMVNVKRLNDAGVTYRLRVGDYRVLFDRDDAFRVIDVIDIRTRAQAYRRW